jgi:hypothetical protein
VTGASGSCDVTGLPSGYTTVRIAAKNTAGYSEATSQSGSLKVVEAGGAMWYTVKFTTEVGNTQSSFMLPQQASTPTALRANIWRNPYGNAFLGWATPTDGTVVYADKASYNFESDVTLKAVWGATPSVTATPSATATPSPSATPSVTTQAATVPGECPVLSGSWTVTAAVGGVTRMVVFSAPTTTSSWTTFKAKANSGQSATISTSSSSGSIQVRGLVKKANNTFTVTGTTANGCSYTSQNSTTP